VCQLLPAIVHQSDSLSEYSRRKYQARLQMVVERRKNS